MRSVDDPRGGDRLPLIGPIGGYLPIVDGHPAPDLLSGERRRIHAAECGMIGGDFSDGRDFYAATPKDSQEFLSAAGTAYLKALGSGDCELFDEILTDVRAYPTRYGTKEAQQAVDMFLIWAMGLIRVEAAIPSWMDAPDLTAFPIAWRHQISYLLALRCWWKGEYAQARMIVNSLLALNGVTLPAGFCTDIGLKVLMARICRDECRVEDHDRWCRESALAAKKDGLVLLFLGKCISPRFGMGKALKEYAPELFAKVEKKSADVLRNKIRLHNHYTGDTVTELLSPREFYIAFLLKRGFRYKEIAARLGVGLGRVNVLVSKIYETLDVHKDVELAKYIW